MRKIFYVPKSKNYMDYESEWKGVTGHIQTGLSDNIEEFVDNPDVAQMILVPEYFNLEIPVHSSNKEYFQVEYYDDFEVLKKEKADITIEFWKKNLDNPSQEEILIDTYPMNYEVGRSIWISNHIKLDIGWYDCVLKKDGVEVDSKEMSVYEYFLEEE
jgi:hypothetical protein